MRRMQLRDWVALLGGAGATVNAQRVLDRERWNVEETDRRLARLASRTTVALRRPA